MALSCASPPMQARRRPARPAQCPYFPIWSRVCWTASRGSRFAWGSRGRCSSGLQHDLRVTPATAARRPRPVRGWLGRSGTSGSPTRVSSPTTPGGTPSSRRAARARIEPRIGDGICGHAPRTVAEAYELPTVEDMAMAIQNSLDGSWVILGGLRPRGR
jgi:hypothetical protein